MKILVTGATGRIGANLVKALLEKDHDIRSLVFPRDPSRAHKLDGFERVETMEGDLRSLDDMRVAVTGVDAIYHIAAAFAGPFDHREYLEINGMGTINLLECVRESAPDLHRFVYACTEAIYWQLGEEGRCFEDPITEDMVARHHHMPYFLTKWIGEELCMAYHHQYGVPSVSMRFATVIEPGEFIDENGLPARFFFNPERFADGKGRNTDEEEMFAYLHSLKTNGPTLFLSRNPDGRAHKQHFADVRDIVQGLVLALEKDDATGEEFTLAGAALFKWDEMIPYLSERYNLPHVDARHPGPNYFEFDLTKIQTLLGFQPRHDLESICDTAEAMRRGEDTGVVPTGIRYGAS